MQSFAKLLQEQERKKKVAMAIGAIARRRRETNTLRPQDHKFGSITAAAAGQSGGSLLHCYRVCAENGLLEIYADEIAEELTKQMVLTEGQKAMMKADREAALAEAMAKREAAIQSGTT